MTFRKPSHWVTLAVTCAILASCGGGNSAPSGTADASPANTAQASRWGAYVAEPDQSINASYTVEQWTSNVSSMLSIIDTATGQPFSGLGRLQDAHASSVQVGSESGKPVFYAVIDQHVVRIDPSEGNEWQAVQISSAANVASIEQIWTTTSSINALVFRTTDDHLLISPSNRAKSQAATTAPISTLNILRSWRNPADMTGLGYTGHLALDPSDGKLVMLSGDLQSVLRRFDEGPQAVNLAEANWIAPSHADAGILRVGQNLYRFEWTGSQANLSAPLYALHSNGQPSGDWYQMATDTQSLALVDDTTVVLLTPDGKVSWTVDLAKVSGMSLPVTVNGLSMSAQAILVPVNKGLLSIDRATGTVTWLDQFNGTHAVNRVLWTSSDSTGYVLNIPDSTHWYEQVIRLNANGVKQVVADHVQVPLSSEVGAEPAEHRELGGFRTIQSMAYPIPRNAYEPTGKHAIWCTVPTVVDQWTCKGRPFIAFNVLNSQQVELGTLNSAMAWVTPPSMIEGHDVINMGDALLISGNAQSSVDDNVILLSETWAFDPTVTGSLHLVESRSW